MEGPAAALLGRRELASDSLQLLTAAWASTRWAPQLLTLEVRPLLQVAERSHVREMAPAGHGREAGGSTRGRRRVSMC
jgi:hypothetical protein